ncbi:hypothetical protein HZH68_016959 [Vespula germanica]|uniref:Uncharacterized protein n=1 Tax=Vespula germanica TaxID=30212 RepID=A0A834MPJ2_VESGE|nr:hypothetical protein HZH68_016959 [Vespula germanica]
MRDCWRNTIEREMERQLPSQPVCVLIDQHCCRIRLLRDGHIDWQSVSAGHNEACPFGKRLANANTVAPGSRHHRRVTEKRSSHFEKAASPENRRAVLSVSVASGKWFGSFTPNSKGGSLWNFKTRTYLLLQRARLEREEEEEEDEDETVNVRMPRGPRA